MASSPTQTRVRRGPPSWNASIIVGSAAGRPSTPKRGASAHRHLVTTPPPQPQLDHSNLNSSISSSYPQNATPSSSSLLSSLLWKCWMCDAPCLEGGWDDMPPLLRPPHHPSSTNSHHSAAPFGGGGAVSSLTLCRRCSKALSSPPGTKLLDIIHQCNSTFASRSRSYTFVAFLREYKLMLEVVDLENGHTNGGVATQLTRSAPTTQHQQQQHSHYAGVLSQLLDCIHSTLDEEAGLRAVHKQQRQHHDGDAPHGRVAHLVPPQAASRGVEWLLKPTERDLLEGESQRHQRSLLWLEKRIALDHIDHERRRAIAVQPHDRRGITVTSPPQDGSNHRIINQRRGDVHHATTDKRATLSVQRVGGREVDHGQQRQSADADEPPQHRQDISDVLRGYFSGELSSLPEQLFDTYLTQPLQSHTDAADLTSSQQGIHRMPVAPLQPDHHHHNGHPDHHHGHPEVHVDHYGTNSSGRSGNTVAVLRTIEEEMMKVRREHDRQRQQWGDERSSLLDELHALKAKVDTFETASIAEQRRYRRSISEQASAVDEATRVSHSLVATSAAFAAWSQSSLQRAAELQRVKSDLLAVEATAIVTSIALEQRSLRRRIDALESEKAEAAKYEQLLLEARRDVMRSVAAASPQPQNLAPQQGGVAASSASSSHVLNTSHRPEVTFF